MELEEKKEVTEIKKVTVGYKCDFCNNTVEAKYLPDSWITIRSQHSEWGNDSCDSVEYNHLCSAKCYLLQVKKLEKKESRRYTFEIEGTMNMPFIKDFLKEVKSFDEKKEKFLNEVPKDADILKELMRKGEDGNYIHPNNPLSMLEFVKIFQNKIIDNLKEL
jgi:hypothetical protein